MALDEEVWRSNLGRGSEIERLRVKGARAAALAAPAACSRGGAAPEKTELGLPGADSNGAGSGGTYAICVIHPRQRNGGLGPGRTLAR